MAKPTVVSFADNNPHPIKEETSLLQGSAFTAVNKFTYERKLSGQSWPLWGGPLLTIEQE